MSQNFWLAFVLKPFLGIAWLAILWYVPHFIAWLLRFVIPDGRFKELLFDGWNGRRSASRADAEQGVFNDPPLIGRELPKDASRL